MSTPLDIRAADFGAMSTTDLKATVRATIRGRRAPNFANWFAELGPYQAMQLQAEHARQLAPVLRNDSEKAAAAAEEREKAAAEEAEAARKKAQDALGYVVNDDGSLTRLRVPEKVLRAKAIVYLSRLQRYLEDLPPRQVARGTSSAVRGSCGG